MTSNSASTTRRSAPVGTWFKSTFSNPDGNQCVEVFFDNDLVHIRDTKNRGSGPVISVPRHQWAAFLDEVAGRAPVGSNGTVQIMVDADGGASLHACRTPDQVLLYTPEEWTAFVAGVHAAEFDLRSVAGLAA
jgi:hypothetical protein